MQKKFTEYVRDKRVIIVGPASYLVGKCMGELIDSYDIVVRLNKSIPLPDELKKDVGTRTDILYNCLHPDSVGEISYQRFKEVDFLVCPYPPKTAFLMDIIRFKRQNNGKIPFRHIDLEYYNQVESKMGTRPNTGTCAILDLLRFPIKELYITGITFFKGGYCKQYNDLDEKELIHSIQTSSEHDIPKQVNYMKDILLSEPRIKLDKELIDVCGQFL